MSGVQPDWLHGGGTPRRTVAHRAGGGCIVRALRRQRGGFCVSRRLCGVVRITRKCRPRPRRHDARQKGNMNNDPNRTLCPRCGYHYSLDCVGSSKLCYYHRTYNAKDFGTIGIRKHKEESTRYNKELDERIAVVEK